MVEQVAIPIGSRFQFLQIVSKQAHVEFIDLGALRQHLVGAVDIALREPADGFVELSVTDTGPGMPPEVLAHVFERFWKSPDSRGSGLGLAIARNLVEAHGGQIGANSRLGEGTTVWFTLPAGNGGS